MPTLDMEVLPTWSLTSPSEKSTIIQGVLSIACISLEETWVLPGTHSKYKTMLEIKLQQI